MTRPAARLAAGAAHERRAALFVALTLCAILLAGATLRLWGLVPPAAGVAYAPDTDEGAYAYSALLMLQGHLPYRDFFATLPPAALYLFAAVQAPFRQPWGGLDSFMALRYASVAYGLATVFVAYLIGRRLGGRNAGLLAAAVLALDGVVIGQDRRAMLEGPMNLASALAVWVYLEATLQKETRRWLLALAGVLGGLAALLKTQAAVVPLTLVLLTLLRRRWRDLLPLIAGGLQAAVLLAGPFLVLCPLDFLKQVYAFQLVRPPDGLASMTGRLRELWGLPYSWLALRLWAPGLVVALAVRWREKEWAGWILVALWAAGALGLIVVSRSYWRTYYAQLALPLALLAGGVLARGVRIPRLRALALARTGVPALVLVGFLGWGAAGHFSMQAGAAWSLIAATKPAFPAVMRYLDAHAGPADAVVATDPLYAMLAGQPLARSAGRPFLADAYGGALYQNLGIAGMTGPQLRALAQAGYPAGADGSATTAVFLRSPAQAEVLAAWKQARYAVIDRRARRQWAPETIQQIERESEPALSLDDVELRVRRTSPASDASGGG